MTSIGKSQARTDALDKVTGKAMYSGDLNNPDQLHLKILFAGRPHAIVKKINTKKAYDLDGVLLVLTAKDVPNNEYGLQIPDQPVLCGPGSDVRWTLFSTRVTRRAGRQSGPKRWGHRCR